MWSEQGQELFGPTFARCRPQTRAGATAHDQRNYSITHGANCRVTASTGGVSGFDGFFLLSSFAANSCRSCLWGSLNKERRAQLDTPPTDSLPQLGAATAESILTRLVNPRRSTLGGGVTAITRLSTAFYRGMSAFKLTLTTFRLDNAWDSGDGRPTTVLGPGAAGGAAHGSR